jgi:hypothetical protein
MDIPAYIFVPNNASLEDNFHITTDARWCEDASLHSSSRWEDSCSSLNGSSPDLQLPPACPKRRQETEITPPKMPRRSKTEIEVQLPKSLDKVLERLSHRLAWVLWKEKELAALSTTAVAA